MNFLCKAQAYLNNVVSTVNSLAGIVMSDELKGNIETQYMTVSTLIELEQSTSEFISEIGLDSELPQAVAISKRKFININERLIKHLEKIQLQGYNFSELISTLKLENATLEKEVHFL
ncbi:MAG: hypothetical protein K2K02_01215 [Ruminococcus sp.]|nr:hypothetical protein [Ruminococcus sp.]